MGLFSKFSDGLKSVVPSKKEDAYGSEYEEEMLDGYDKELATSIQPKRTKSAQELIEEEFNSIPAPGKAPAASSYDDTEDYGISDSDFDIPDDDTALEGLESPETAQEQSVAKPAFPVYTPPVTKSANISSQTAVDESASAPSTKKPGFFEKFRKKKKDKTVPAAPHKIQKKKKSHSGVKVHFDVKQVGLVAVLFLMLGLLGLLLFGGPSKNKIAKNTSQTQATQEADAPQTVTGLNEKDSYQERSCDR